MPTPHIDHTEILSMSEHLGIVTQLTRLCRVTNVVNDDYTVLMEGLATAGIPDYGDRPVAFNIASTDPNYRFRMLVLVDRKVKLTSPSDISSVDVTLDYQHILDADNQNLSGTVPGMNPGLKVLFGKNRTSVQQTKTNFFWDFDYQVPDWSPTAAYQQGNIVLHEGLFWYRLVNESVYTPRSAPSANQVRSVARWRYATPTDLVATASVPSWAVNILNVEGDVVRYAGLTDRIYKRNGYQIGITVGAPSILGALWWTVAREEDAAIAPNRVRPDWDANTVYAPGVTVIFNGNIYIRLTTPDFTGPPYANPFIQRADAGFDFYLWRIATTADLEPYIDPNAPLVRRQIVVRHTYPDGRQSDPQGGEITVMQPHRNFTVQGYKATATPWIIEKGIINRVNERTWMDGGKWEWMCTEVTWEAIDANKLYKMKFEFQHNPDTWQPTAVYIDSKTGKPPAGLIPGVGSRQIEYHDEIDFNNFFRATFEGWVNIQ